MRAGITGAVGFLGANLVKYLYENCSEDFSPVPFYSSRRKNPLTDDLNLQYIHLDVTSKEDVLAKTKDLDVLFHLAGVVDYSRKHARRTWDVNVLGAKNIFDAVMQNNIDRLVFISSINVLGTIGTGSCPAGETNRVYQSPGNPISFRNRDQALAAVEASIHGDYSFLGSSRVPYFDSKLAAYELAADYSRNFDLPVIVVLPGTAVGRGDLGFAITRLVYRVYMGRLKFTLPGGTSFVSAEDVAEGIWLSYLLGKTGQSYIITGGDEDNLSYMDFMKLAAKVARNRYNRPVSDFFLAVPASVCYALAGVLRLLSVDGELSEALLLSGAAVHKFSHAKAGRDLGYHPKHTLEHSVEACIEFYLQKIIKDDQRL
jgi:dihydroflavonol-4-reductase